LQALSTDRKVYIGLIDFPDIIGMFEGAKNAGLERDIANAIVSALASSWITFTWRSGSSRWAQYLGEGRALQDSATAMYVTLRALEKKNFLTLSVPSDMLTQENLSKFTPESKTK